MSIKIEIGFKKFRYFSDENYMVFQKRANNSEIETVRLIETLYIFGGKTRNTGCDIRNDQKLKFEYEMECLFHLDLPLEFSIIMMKTIFILVIIVFTSKILLLQTHLC